MNHPYSWIEDSLKTLHRANWYRRVKTDSRPESRAVIELEGRSLINFASNDYLGLAADERMIAGGHGQRHNAMELEAPACVY
jgi:8-amino-7-oxononanoate synthase